MKTLITTLTKELKVGMRVQVIEGRHAGDQGHITYIAPNAKDIDVVTADYCAAFQPDELEPAYYCAEFPDGHFVQIVGVRAYLMSHKDGLVAETQTQEGKNEGTWHFCVGDTNYYVTVKN